MPNKYPVKKGWDVPKQKYKVTNWSDYNAALCQRGEIDVWLSLDAVLQWYEADRVYDGTGTPQRFTDFAIITCHEIRQVYRLPLRQTQGFINSLFRQNPSLVKHQTFFLSAAIKEYSAPPLGMEITRTMISSMSKATTGGIGKDLSRRYQW